MALGFTMNPGEVGAILDGIVSTFDFTLTGAGGQSLGRDVASQIALGIARRSANALDPDGNPWKPNAPKYAAYKERRYDVYQPGELGGQMLSQQSLLGTPTVTPDSIEMNYGTGRPPGRTTSVSGVALKPSELDATDTDKAEWFEEGGREFYALDDAIADEVFAAVADRVGRHLADMGF